MRIDADDQFLAADAHVVDFPTPVKKVERLNHGHAADLHPHRGLEPPAAYEPLELS